LSALEADDDWPFDDLFSNMARAGRAKANVNKPQGRGRGVMVNVAGSLKHGFFSPAPNPDSLFTGAAFSFFLSNHWLKALVQTQKPKQIMVKINFHRLDHLKKGQKILRKTT
jgi:hypothetical protein